MGYTGNTAELRNEVFVVSFDIEAAVKGALDYWHEFAPADIRDNVSDKVLQDHLRKDISTFHMLVGSLLSDLDPETVGIYYLDAVLCGGDSEYFSNEELGAIAYHLASFNYSMASNSVKP